MKKSLLITAAALLLSVCAFAQEFGGWQRGERPDEATIIKMRTDRMVQQLGLDETQAAKLLELNQKYPNVMRGGRPGGPGMGRPQRGERPEEFVPSVENQDNAASSDKKQKKDKKAKKEQKKKDKEAEKAAMDEQSKDMEAYEAELKEILTNDQYKTWEDFKNNRPQGPGGRPGGFGPGGRPGGFGPGGPGGRPGGFGGPGGPGGTTYPSREL